MSDASIEKQLKIADGPDQSARFAEIAHVLLNELDLVVAGSTRFQLAEVEFYLNSAAHPDVFAHGDPQQERFCEWYFHRSGGKSYKEGTYRGLDLALGTNKMFCGVLIRSLRDSKGKVIQGSCLSVNAILAAAGAVSVADLADPLVRAGRRGAASTDEKHPLRLVRAASARSDEIDRSMRVGLTLKKADHKNERLRFFGAEYRFTTASLVIRKGAPQQVAALSQQRLDNAAIAHKTGIKPKTVAVYVASFKKGMTKPLAQLFGQAIKPADYAEAYGRYRGYVEKGAQSGAAADDNNSNDDGDAAADDVDED